MSGGAPVRGAGALTAALILASCGHATASSSTVSSSTMSPPSRAVAATSSGGPTAPQTSLVEPSSTIVPDASTIAVTPSTADTGAASATGGRSVGTAPLTGLPGSDPAQATRPALIVKIDGQRLARPQFNLDRADLVIEEIVEGITRFMAVFQSEVPDIVGPVRSARTQDMLIAPMFHHPLFAWSGGNAGVSALVASSPVVNLSATKGRKVFGMWFRTRARRAPHNLLARGPLLVDQTPPGLGAPPQLFLYRSAGDVPHGEGVSGVKLTMSGTSVLWTWDGGGSAWLRTQDGVAHRVDSGARIAATNVVVLETPYAMSAADAHSPEAQTVGSGIVWVFSGGVLVRGRWTRPRVEEPWSLTDSSGQPIRLLPGRTWIELARPGHAVPIGPGVDPASVPYPHK
jgi:hypothetical protein